MRYTVVWKPEAERRLADLWITAGDRPALTEAANRIDAALQTDPDTVGESREPDRRALLEPPLGVVFKVLAEDRLVQVLAVWQFDIP